MESLGDNKLSKNIRPMLLIYMIVFLTIIAVVDAASGSFTMPEAYIDLFKVLSSTMVLAYYGSRGIEKAVALGSNK